MSLFIIVSGFFFKPSEPFGPFLVKKFNRLIVPFMFYSFATWVVTTAIVAGWHPEILSKQLVRPFFILAGLEFNSAIYGNNPLWFLTFLFSVSLICFAIYKFTRTRLQTFLAAVAVAAAGIMITQYIPVEIVSESLAGKTRILLPYYLNGAMGAIVFFWFGSLYFPLIRKRLKALVRWQSVTLIILCFGLYFLLYRYNFPEQRGAISPVDLRLCSYGNYILLHYMLVGLMFVALVLLCNLIGRVRFINYIGRNAILVLIFNFPVKHLLFAVFPGIEPYWWLQLTLYLALSVPFIWLVNNYLPWTIGEKPLLKQEWVFAKFPFLRPRDARTSSKENNGK